MGLKIQLRFIQIHSARAVALSLMNFLNPRNVIRHINFKLFIIIGRDNLLKNLRNFFRRWIIFNMLGQLIFIGFFMLMFYLLLIYGENIELFRFNFSQESFLDTLEILIQIIGLLASFLVGFFFFAFQNIESSRMNWFLAIKDETKKLKELVKNIPKKYEFLKPYLSDIIYLFGRRLNEYPIVTDDWEPLNKLVEVLDEHNLSYNNMLEEYTYINEIIDIINNLESYSGELGILSINIITKKSIISKITKLFILLINFISIDIIIRAFNVSFLLNRYFLLLLITFCFLLFIFVCFDVITIVNDYYRNIMTDIIEKD